MMFYLAATPLAFIAPTFTIYSINILTTDTLIFLYILFYSNFSFHDVAHIQQFH
jgi:hypothetical protein